MKSACATTSALMRFEYKALLAAIAAALALVCSGLFVQTAYADEADSDACDEGISLLATEYTRTVSGTQNQAEARKLLALVNQARAAKGVAALKWDSNLEAAAMQRAAEITIKFDHVRPNGYECKTLWPSSYLPKYGENIANGQNSVTAVNSAWTNSSIHYQNMMDKGFKSFGAACFKASNGQLYWVEAFSGASGNGKNAATNTAKSFTVELVASPYSDVALSHWAFSGGYVPYVTEKGLMGGVSGSSRFEPNSSVTRGMVATIIYRAATGKTAQNTNNNVSSGFKDVKSGEWWTAAIRWCQQNGIITGYPADNTFRPGANVTREQLATMLGRYAAWKKSGGKSTAALSASSTEYSKFSDVKKVTGYAANYMKWCTANKVITGNNGKINPQNYASRAELAKMITIVVRDLT